LLREVVRVDRDPENLAVEVVVLVKLLLKQEYQ
jgi:hypothetical protein